MTEKEYNTTVETHANALFRFIYKNLKVREDAENIVQDTFEGLWLNIEKVEFSKAKSWIFTTGYRKMIDLIRKDKKMADMPEFVKERGSEASQPDMKEIINNAMDRLPEIQRTVIMLRDYEGYDYAEIGKIAGLTESQVKVYIFRGRQTLKNYIVNLENII
ncbi:MAG: RNA polymerase sigma factor [bacterium]|nr:RNA polymerase sigma factor [bacterium]